MIKQNVYAFENMKQFVITMESPYLTDFIKNSENYIDTKNINIPQNIVFPKSGLFISQI